jgi:hypothetical protein
MRVFIKLTNLSQLLLGCIAIGPWLLLIVYDALLYLFRTATYEIPYIGGRARNRPRPRAPSLSERPNGIARRLTLPRASAFDGAGDLAPGLKQRGDGPDYNRDDSKTVEE